MKVYINRYKDHWLSPYTILERVCFWEQDRDRFYNLEDQPNNPYEPWVNRLVPVCRAIQWVLDLVHPRIQCVKIDPWDTWSMDSTLGQIALPMLRQLYINKQGAAQVEDQDVPENLRSTAAPPRENEWDPDANLQARWDWVLEEMIFAFEHHLDESWRDRFSSGEPDHRSVPCEWDSAGKPTMYRLERGPNDTYECDWEGIKKVQQRIDNGFRLFGRYYQSLWD